MAMASRALHLLKGATPTNHRRLLLTCNIVACSYPITLLHAKLHRVIIRSCSSSSSSLEPPDVPRLAETARISLTPQEIEEFTPKIRQVVDWSYLCKFFRFYRGIGNMNVGDATNCDKQLFLAKDIDVIWFGQLQDVELQSVEPALRADTDGDQLREDVPELFDNREALISSVPSYEEPFIKVPKVLNKESE